MAKGRNRGKHRSKNHSKNNNNRHKHNNQSVYKNQNAKQPKKVRLSVMQITETLYGSNYIDWKIYTDDEIHSNLGEQKDGRVAREIVRESD
jgi:hypothetical protein